MSPAVAESEAFALELHGFLRDLDPATWRDGWEATARARLVRVRAAVDGLLERLASDGALSRLADALRVVREVLGAAPPPTLAAGEARRAWKAFRARLAAAYDALSLDLAAWDIHVPGLRPTNYARNVVHAGMATLAILVLALWRDRTSLLLAMTPFVIFALVAETTRRRSTRVNAWMMAFFGPIAHPHERHRVNSATWFTVGLLALAAADVPAASAVALATLGFGDPAAAIVGRRFGRTRLLHGRTLEGSAACAAVGGVAGLLALRALFPHLPVGASVAASFAGAGAGAAAEVISRRVDDNLAIPLTAAAAAACAFWMLGVPLR